MKRDIGTRAVPNNKNPQHTPLNGEVVCYTMPLEEIEAYFEKLGVKPFPKEQQNWLGGH